MTVRACLVVPTLLAMACAPVSRFDAARNDATTLESATDAPDAMDAATVDTAPPVTDSQPVACPPADVATPVVTDGGDGTTVIALVAGARFTCALASDGSARCWGENLHGQLGADADAGFARAMPVRVAGLEGATQLAAGAEHACALLGDGGVVCWGRNQHGQLGDGTTTDRSAPVPVALEPATRVATGATWTCALTSVGTRCWGSDATGLLDNGADVDHPTPMPVVSLATAIRFALGTTHACGLFADGSAQCWGDDGFGQLGDCMTAVRHAPAHVTGLPAHVIDVAVGLRHGCAVAADGSVWCWGNDLEGEVGVDGFVSDPCRLATEDGNVHGAVVVPGLAHATAVALGGASSCARTDDGAVWCWGQNRYGQLGDCTPDGRALPARVAGLPAVTDVVAGDHHVCARTMDGVAWCFGANESGQLGVDDSASHATPVRVPW